MLISLNEIKKYVSIPDDLTNQDLVDLIGSRLVEVEDVIDLAPKYKGIYVVKVVKSTPIEGTHLNLCEVDAGAHNAEFPQLENGLVQVVCGAPNARTGILAAWITPGSIVPQTYGNENFKLGTRKLQGYNSNGMLAAADELDLGSDHDGIIEIDPKMARPGDSFADIFELNDLILDVENKSLTHRPDCFGLIGFAREVAGILGIKFAEPEWPELQATSGLPISVKITDEQLCPRYSCAVLGIPKHEKSRYLTLDDVFLAKAGMRSIDPMVDLTNIIMLQTGQPLHAFDYDKLVAVGGTDKPNIIVRAAAKGEEIQLLDGKVIQCDSTDILITSNNIPVALAGAMGGKNTEIDASTKRIVLESATFSLYNLRKTQMAHGIFSEAITRFTKGQPAAMTMPVLAKTIAELHPDVLAVVDAWLGQHTQNVVKITTDEVNQLLGSDYSVAQIIATLTNVGFEVVSEPSGVTDNQTAVAPTSEAKIRQKASPEPTEQNALLSVTAPAWRTDIHIKEDIIEEVGRLLGFDNIPLSLPKGEFKGTEIAPMIQLKSQIRSVLSDQLAMNELLTYSFVSKSLLEKVGENPDNSYEITNSISPELQCFRQQIAPSLLDKVRENIKAGHDEFTLYEINQTTSRDLGLDAEGVPVMQTNLGILCLGDYYSLKAKIFALMEHGLNFDLEYIQMAPGSEAAKKYPYLEPMRSVELIINGQKIGAFGEVKAAVKRRFKLEGVVSAGEITLDEILDLPHITTVDVKLSKFPSVERDLTVKVAADMPFGRVDEAIRSAFDAQNLIYQVDPVSVYQAEPESKNLSFHLKFASLDGTLDANQIAIIMKKITITTAKIGAIAV